MSALHRRSGRTHSTCSVILLTEAIKICGLFTYFRPPVKGHSINLKFYQNCSLGKIQISKKITNSQVFKLNVVMMNLLITFRIFTEFIRHFFIVDEDCWWCFSSIWISHANCLIILLVFSKSLLFTLLENSLYIINVYSNFIIYFLLLSCGVHSDYLK